MSPYVLDRFSVLALSACMIAGCAINFGHLQRIRAYVKGPESPEGLNRSRHNRPKPVSGLRRVDEKRPPPKVNRDIFLLFERATTNGILLS